MKINKLSIFLLFGLLVSCANGTKKVSLANEFIMDYWDNYVIDESPDYMVKDQDEYYPVPLRYEFKEKDDVTKREVLVSTNKNMDDAVKYVSSGKFVDIENLYANTDYYLKEFAYNGSDVVYKSDVKHYQTSDYPRTLRIPNVHNTRDIGGLKTEDGHRVKQGLVYRGANLDEIKGKEISLMVDELGIKTDFDLRREDEGYVGVDSPLGQDVNYINISGVAYADGENGIKYLPNKDTIRREIEVFANKDNYPIYFHCVVGRDRTGTLGIILESLLGVDIDTVLKEYGLSFFSTYAYVDGQTVDDMFYHADNVILHIMYKGQKEIGDTLAKRTENWLIDTIGVSKEDIDTIRDILIDK